PGRLDAAVRGRGPRAGLRPGGRRGAARPAPSSARAATLAPSPMSPARRAGGGHGALVLPRDTDDVEVRFASRSVRLTNVNKPFWPELGITKGDLLQYYADVAPALLPHIGGRAMVMKRYPHGAAGEFFFMKRAPTPRPDWIEICSIDHGSENIIDFPMIQDRAALMWVINLGCIDLNQWYATCDDVDRPDYLHFDLDPGVGATFDRVLETALVVRGARET